MSYEIQKWMDMIRLGICSPVDVFDWQTYAVDSSLLFCAIVNMLCNLNVLHLYSLHVFVAVKLFMAIIAMRSWLYHVLVFVWALNE